ncbi:hypothetical protein AGMMS50256_32920 [Betaproteobacteria bacterium]|nr:hypothetical protein AGMMS50256_32920 [Betaproteobacteria bacterium]
MLQGVLSSLPIDPLLLQTDILPPSLLFEILICGTALRIKLCAATVGYILRKWSVDCSPDHSLRGHEFRLWLKDHLALYAVKNAVLAPSYSTTPKEGS